MSKKIRIRSRKRRNFSTTCSTIFSTYFIFICTFYAHFMQIKSTFMQIDFTFMHFLCKVYSKCMQSLCTFSYSFISSINNYIIIIIKFNQQMIKPIILIIHSITSINSNIVFIIYKINFNFIFFIIFAIIC